MPTVFSTAKIAALAAFVIRMMSTSAYAELTKVRYANVTDITLSQAPVIVAQELGYFKDEGLDVEVMGFKGTGTLIPQMLAKRVYIGYPNPDTIILSNAPGQKRLPLKFFYNSTRSSGWEFIVPAESPIKTLKDLDGKTLGVGAMSFGNVPITKAEFKELGINATMVPVGIGSAAFLALTSKKIDALNLFDTQHATLEVQGTKIRRLPQLPRYANLFSNGFIASDEMIKEKPQVLTGFGRAVAKATVFCEANREACVELFWKKYPNTRPGGDAQKVLADNVQVFNSRFNKMLDFPAGQPRQWGQYDEKTWQNFVDALYDGGQLQSKEINLANCYTNALVPAMSDFDAAAVVAQAKSYKVE